MTGSRDEEEASADGPTAILGVKESLGGRDLPQYLTPLRLGSTERGWRRKITRYRWLCILGDRSGGAPCGSWGRVRSVGRRGSTAKYVEVPHDRLLAGPQATPLRSPVALERSSASKG